MRVFIFLLAMLPAAFQLHSQIPNYVPTNGLQGYWPFTGNANDMSGNNNNGTLNGPTAAPDRFGNASCAYSFNGYSDYIATNYAGILGSSPRALAFWAKTTESVATMCAASWGDNQQGTRYSGAFNYAATGITFGGAYAAITYSPPVNAFDNGWHHYVFQFSGTTINQVQIYQDAIPVTQTVSAYNPTSLLNTLPAYNVTFGMVSYLPSPDYFNGLLDDIGIWNRTLTPCEIQNLYASALPAISFTPAIVAVCPGQQATITAGGVSSYSWATPASNSASIMVPAAAGIYSVQGTKGYCTTSNTIAVTVKEQPTLSVAASPSVICAGATATITASGANSYSWTNGPGNTNSIIVTPNVTTTYTVTGTGLNGCMAQAQVSQFVTTCVGINSLTMNTDFGIYPNPAKSTVAISTAAGNKRIELYDVLGALVHKQQSDDERTVIDLSTLPKGIYFVTLISKEQTLTKKLVIE